MPRRYYSRNHRGRGSRIRAREWRHEYQGGTFFVTPSVPVTGTYQVIWRKTTGTSSTDTREVREFKEIRTNISIAMPESTSTLVPSLALAFYHKFGPVGTADSSVDTDDTRRIWRPQVWALRSVDQPIIHNRTFYWPRVALSSDDEIEFGYHVIHRANQGTTLSLLGTYANHAMQLSYNTDE